MRPFATGTDPLARDERGRVADPTSCMNWNTAAFSRLALLSEFELCLGLGEVLNARDSDGNTPLHLAAESENPSVVTFLLEAGADANATYRTIGVYDFTSSGSGQIATGAHGGH